MAPLIRLLLRGTGLLVVGAVFSFIGCIIGQELRGPPAAPLALGLGLMAIAGTWCCVYRQKRRLAGSCLTKPEENR